MQSMHASFKPGKSCGCVIASNIIDLEIQKRKKQFEIKKLREKLTKTKSNREPLSLKRKHKELMSSLNEIHKHKKYMKKKFEDYVKDSGYVPPRFKNKR